MKRVAAILLLFSAAVFGAEPRSVVLIITMDGMRWQEVFGGADERLINRKDETLQREFVRETAEARREVLLPFVWNVIARQGQIFGNPAKGNIAQVTNGKKFSYPGYQELLCGFPDPRIDSNDKVPNPNVSVLEWLERRPGFAGQVAAFGTWDVLPSILNRERSRLPVLAATEPIRDDPLTERQAAINDLLHDTTMPFGEGNPLDSFACHAALEHLKRHKPRVLYVMFGETDEWAHEGNYGRYLHSARREDLLVRKLWEAAQSIAPGAVSLIMTTDHGRGAGPEWTSHGEKIQGAENIWIAVLGPRVAPLGERTGPPRVTQSQVAATAALLAGEDYAGAVSKAARPLPVEEGRARN